MVNLLGYLFRQVFYVALWSLVHYIWWIYYLKPDSVLQKSEIFVLQVHKELQETMAQLDAIRHEIRSVSFMNPGPLTTRLVDNVHKQTPAPDGTVLCFTKSFIVSGMSLFFYGLFTCLPDNSSS